MRRSTGSSTQNEFSFLSHSQLVSKARQQAAETAQWELQVSPRSQLRRFGADLSIADEFGSPGRLSNTRSPSSMSPSRRSMPAAVDISTSMKSDRSTTSPLGRRSRTQNLNASPRSPLEKEVIVTIHRPSHEDQQLDAMTQFLSSSRAAMNESARCMADQATDVDATLDTTRRFGYASPNDRPRPYSKELFPKDLSTVSAETLSPSRSMEWSLGVSQSGIKNISRDGEMPVVPKISNAGSPLLEISRTHAVQMAVEQANQKMREVNECSLPIEHTPTRGNEHRWSPLQATEPSPSHDLRITRLEEELMQARAKIRSLTTEVLYLREEKSLAAEKQKAFARASHAFHDQEMTNTWG